MTKIAPRQVDSFLATPDPALRAVLIYGPDSGLVRERSRTLAKTLIRDMNDPFLIADITPAQLKADKALLADEMAAQSLIGGRRLVWLRDGADEHLAAIEAALATPLTESFLLIEAGDLGPRSRLRRWAEQSDQVGALACYRDDAESIARLAQRLAREAGKNVSPDALTYLAGQLGGDRGITRQELDKLILYAGSQQTISLEDAILCVGDTAALDLDALAFAVAGGDPNTVDRILERLLREGTAAISVIRMISRHFQRLHLVQAAVEGGGKTVQQAVKGLRPPVFFRYESQFIAQVRLWGGKGAAALTPPWALARLHQAEIGCKSTHYPTDSVCSRALMEIAVAAKRAPR